MEEDQLRECLNKLNCNQVYASHKCQGSCVMSFWDHFWLSLKGHGDWEFPDDYKKENVIPVFKKSKKEVQRTT